MFILREKKKNEPKTREIEVSSSKFGLVEATGGKLFSAEGMHNYDSILITPPVG